MKNYKVGQRVQVYDRARGGWIVGEITDIFRGPLSGQTVIVVNDTGYYLHEVREALASVA